MKKNIVLFFLIILSCTGCHVDYRLNVDNLERISENVSLTADNEDDRTQFTDFKKFVPIDKEADDYSIFESKVDGVNYYDIFRDSNSMKFRYNNYNVDTLNKGMLSHQCYKYVTIMNNSDDREFLLSTSREFLCFDKYDNLEEVDVHIISKYKLKETNADSVNGHEYVWNINRSNFKDKYLYLLLDTSKRDLTLWERIVEGEFTNMFTISLLVLVVGGIIGFILKKRGDYRNRI